MCRFFSPEYSKTDRVTLRYKYYLWRKIYIHSYCIIHIENGNSQDGMKAIPSQKFQCPLPINYPSITEENAKYYLRVVSSEMHSSMLPVCLLLTWHFFLNLTIGRFGWFSASPWKLSGNTHLKNVCNKF